MHNDYEKKQIKEYLSCKRLSIKEEQELLNKAVNDQDKVSQNKIIESHLYIVAFTALKQDYMGMSLVDLMQEGILGLWDALKTFDISSGNRFSTLAGHHVRWKIKKTIDRNKRQQPADTSSLDAPLSYDDDKSVQLLDTIEDTHHVSAEFEFFMQETQESIGCDLITLGEFIDGTIIAPFDRIKIANGIFKSKRNLSMNYIDQECVGWVFGSSDPFQRCNLFKRLICL